MQQCWTVECVICHRSMVGTLLDQDELVRWATEHLTQTGHDVRVKGYEVKGHSQMESWFYMAVTGAHEPVPDPEGSAVPKLHDEALMGKIGLRLVKGGR